MLNKSILMSIRPQYVAKILNGEKNIEVRKKFPKDYVGWVYIYCTKGKEKLFRCKLHVVHNIDGTGMHNQYETYTKYGVAKNLDAFQDNIHENVRKQLDITDSTHGELDLYDYVEEYEWEDDELNGKVVARFWCDKVEKIVPYKHFTNDCDYNYHYRTYDVPYEKLLDYTCLNNDELDNYLYANIGYALHVAKRKVEIFEKPKDISAFHNIDFCKYLNAGENDSLEHFNKVYEETKLKKAPQSWCYVEG